jgi:hypothetical protein
MTIFISQKLIKKKTKIKKISGGRKQKYVCWRDHQMPTHVLLLTGGKGPFPFPNCLLLLDSVSGVSGSTTLYCNGIVVNTVQQIIILGISYRYSANFCYTSYKCSRNIYTSQAKALDVRYQTLPDKLHLGAQMICWTWSLQFGELVFCDSSTPNHVVPHVKITNPPNSGGFCGLSTLIEVSYQSSIACDLHVQLASSTKHALSMLIIPAYRQPKVSV